MEYTLAAAFFVVGACVGSFVNVAVLRFGFSERDNPRSHCAACMAQLSVLDLVPVFSYIVLSGRCRRCGSRVSLQYPVVEIICGVLFATSVVVLGPYLAITDFLVLGTYLGFWASLLALVVYDIRHTLVPLPFIWVTLGFVVVSVLLRGTYVDAVGAALVCGGFFACIHFLTRGKGMGIGDAYVAALIGGMLGLVSGVWASALGVWIGAAVGVLLLAANKVFPHARLLLLGHRVTLKSEVPFAPFLALGAVLAFLFTF
jgi:leader peptidase (prepilin peptidase)/N-methyltransferase